MSADAPMQTCGRDAKTFAYYALGELWLCPKCYASIGRLGECCARCGVLASSGALLVPVFRVGQLCLQCRREHVRAAGLQLRGERNGHVEEAK